MKPTDTSGEYTPQEVKAALAGIDGTRQLSFRYERLDSSNNFIEDLDYVNSCSIENNSLADIKRTAKFSILDTGTINYLQDRIKPYVRLHMPESESYHEYVKSIKPDVWWKMDDPDQPLIYATVRNPANGLTYNTFDTAYDVLEGDVVYANITGSNDTTNRNVFWAKISITANNPVDIYSYLTMRSVFNNVTTTINKRTVYVQTGTTIDDLAEIPEDIQFGGQPNWYDIEQVFPELKTYYFKFETMQPDTVSSQVRLEWWRPRRISDTSGNEFHALAMGTYFQFPGIVQDGGYSVTNQNNIQTAKREFVTGPTFAGSVWLGTSSTALKHLFSSYYETIDNTAYPEDSDCEAWIDFQTGKVCLYAGFNSYQYDTRVEKSFDSAFLRRVKHFAWSVNVLEDRWVFWLDGIEHVLDPSTMGVGNQSKDLIPAVSRANRVELKPTTSSAASKFDDFVWFNNAELGDEAVKKIYRLGNTGGQTRKGYVEWPQGVFVLSSPTRSMKEGNVITRDVEGYDQLVVLKEDSFDKRYTVRAGVKYTQAVASVLQSSTLNQNFPLTDKNLFWDAYSEVTNGDAGGAIITSANSISFNAAANRESAVGTHSGQFFGFDGISVSCKPDFGNGMQYFNLVVACMDPDYVPQSQIMSGIIVNPVTACIYISDPHTAFAYQRATYNPAIHKYFRIRESSGRIYFDYSTNGTTWFTIYSTANTFQPGLNAQVQFEGGRPDAAYTGGATEIVISAKKMPKFRITNSALKVPTAMEWEPGTSKLQVINDLLGAVNYESASYDENGIFVARPYVSPANRGSEFTYATDSESVITGDVDQTVDLFKVPNKWIISVSEADRVPLTATYENNNPSSPTSIVSRGRTIVDFRTEQDAPDQATLNAKVERLAFEASQVYEKIEFDTALMPIHSTNDVYDLIIDGLVIENKFAETSWSMELKSGSTMSHEVRRITNV